MDLFSAKAARAAELRQQYAVGKVVETPSLGEAFWLDYESQVAEFNTNSEVIAEQRFNGEADIEIREMIDSGEIPDHVVEGARKVRGYISDYDEEVTYLDMHALKAWANENLEASFDSTDEAMKETMRAEREYRQQKMDAADFWGKAYGMAGSIYAMTKDPVTLMVTFTPFGGVKNGNTILGIAARAALREGAIAAAAEIPLQVKSYEFAQRLESPYTVGDAFTNVALAGLLGGVIGGGIDVGRHAARRARSIDDPITTVADQIDQNSIVIRSLEEQGPLKGDERALLDRMKEQNVRLSALDPEADASAALKEMDDIEARMTDEVENTASETTDALEEAVEAADEPDPQAVPERRTAPQEDADGVSELDPYDDYLPEYDENATTLRLNEEGEVVEESLFDGLARDDLDFDQEFDRLESFVECVSG